ncbi:MAG: hypothetical protein KKH99_14690, partial [Proteobacteria bacterium]|nr:hypothetical protein [Pseudomonadota bacterium]
VAANSSVTDYQGLWIWNWDTTGQAEGNYTATTYGNKTGYNDNYDYEWFEILIDTTGPVSTLDRPLADSTVDGVALGFTYTVNATVTDADVGIIDTVTFMYRYNDTDTWKLICRDQDGTAPFECNWDLSGLSNGWDYEVLVYANDSLGNLGDNNTHINITVITEYINITSILVDDSVDIPLDQIDLIAGTTKTVYCNLTIWDPEVYTNISSVNATFYSSTTTFDASDANQTHYTNTSCTLISGGGNTADYVCGFTVWHFALNGTWECRGYTENLYSSNISLDNTTVSQLFAINISTTLINYTDLEPDQESPNVEVNVSNVGNMPMNISVYGFGGEDELGGTDLSMICEINNISVEFERFSTSSGVAYDSKNQLSSTPQDIGLTIPAKANEAEVKSNSTYWQFMVPPHEQAFGQCNGSVVFMAESP